MATLCGEAVNVIENDLMKTSQQISTSNCLDEKSEINSYTDNRALNLASIAEGTYFITNPHSCNTPLSINTISTDCSSYGENVSSQQDSYPFNKNHTCNQQRNIVTSYKKHIESEFSTPLHFARNMDDKMKMSPSPNKDMNNFINNNEIKESSNSARSILENTNALKLALNLSLYGLNEIRTIPKNPRNEDESSMCQIMQMNSLAENKTVETFSTKLVCSQHLNVNPMIDERSKKSQNMTECVPVPSSEHVAEIVGRQGCKIKALRAKTNTYIKTPVRGEEPVFVVTGRKEDVAKAKQEILSAADHFSLIRASRKTSLDEASCGNLISNSNARNQPGLQLQPGQVTIQVRVPYRVVGLVVGPKGATIKHIQQETHTYIVTPSREREPVFEVTGTPENVQTAQRQIESHIALRTGVVNHEEQGSPPIINQSDLCQREDLDTLKKSKAESIEQDILIKLCRRGISSALSYIDNQKTSFHSSPSCSKINESSSIEKGTKEKVLSVGTGPFPNQLPLQLQDLRMVNFKQNDEIYENVDLCQNDKNIQKGVPKLINDRTGKEYECVNIINCQNISNKTNFSASSTITSTVGFNNSCSSASSTASSRSACKSGDVRNNPKYNTRPELVNIWQNIKDSLDIDEGIEETSNNWTLTSHTTNINESHGSPTASTSPADSLLGDLTFSSNSYTQNNAVLNSTLQLKPYSSLIHQDCLVCNKNSISAALVPCGHNVFCIDCANRICSSLDASCPICSLTVYHAIRLLV